MQQPAPDLSTPLTRPTLAILVAILLLGAFVQVYQVGNGSALTVHDEAWLYTVAYDLLQGRPVEAVDLVGYPPGLFIIEQAVYCVINGSCQGDAYRTPDVVRAVLVLAGLTNLVTAVGMFALARQWSSDVGGLLAACAWVVLPVVHERTVIALTEAWQACAFVGCALWMTLLVKTHKPAYALLSVAAGLGAVVFKYSAFPVLGLPAAAALWLWWRVPTQRTRWTLVLIAQALMIAVCAAVLLFAYDARAFFNNPNEVANFLGGGNPHAEFFSSQRGILRVLDRQALQLGLPAVVVWTLLVIGAGLALRQQAAWRALSWGLCAALLVFHLLFILTYIIFWSGVLRYITPVAGLSLALLAAAASWAAVWVSQRSGRPRWAPAALALLGTLWLLPNGVASVQTAVARAWPHSRDAMVRWSETSLPTDGTLLIRDDDWLYFSATFADYQVPERTWLEGQYPLKSLAEWRARGIRYAVITEDERAALDGDPTRRAELASLTLLKHFPPAASAAQWRGVRFGVYWLEAPQVSLGIRFGEDIVLEGYDLDAATARPGDALTLRPYWRAFAQPSAEYNVYLHLTRPNDRDVLAQADGPPALPGRPTSTWDDPDELLLGNTFQIALPADLAPGEYRLLIGLYDWQTGARLTTASGEDYVELSRVVVSG